MNTAPASISPTPALPAPTPIPAAKANTPEVSFTATLQTSLAAPQPARPAQAPAAPAKTDSRPEKKLSSSDAQPASPGDAFTVAALLLPVPAPAPPLPEVASPPSVDTSSGGFSTASPASPLPASSDTPPVPASQGFQLPASPADQPADAPALVSGTAGTAQASVPDLAQPNPAPAADLRAPLEVVAQPQSTTPPVHSLDSGQTQAGAAQPALNKGAASKPAGQPLPAQPAAAQSSAAAQPSANTRPAAQALPRAPKPVPGTAGQAAVQSFSIHPQQAAAPASRAEQSLNTSNNSASKELPASPLQPVPTSTLSNSSLTLSSSSAVAPQPAAAGSSDAAGSQGTSSQPAAAASVAPAAPASGAGDNTGSGRSASSGPGQQSAQDLQPRTDFSLAAPVVVPTAAAPTAHATAPEPIARPTLSASNPEPSANPIQAARLLQSAGGTEIHLGLHSSEFGSISIATSVSSGSLQASIAVDHGALGHAIAAHLPAIEEKFGIAARVEVRDPGATPNPQGNPQSSPQGSRQNRAYTAPAPTESSAHGEPVTSAVYAPSTSTARLSVLA